MYIVSTVVESSTLVSTVVETNVLLSITIEFTIPLVVQSFDSFYHCRN